METTVDPRQQRAVLVQTVRGPIEGVLDVGLRTRTSDFLNLNCSRFVPLTIGEPPDGATCFSEGDLVVSSSSVLFIAERGIRRNLSDERVEAARYTRTGVRLSLGAFEVEGFVHLPGLSDLMSWLIKNRHPFMSMTAVSVCGPSEQFAASFLAFNPRHVQLVQQFDPLHELARLEPAAGGVSG